MKQDIASRLRERVTLEQPTHTPDGEGGWEMTWEEAGTVWADVRARTGQETEMDFQHAARQAYDVWLRFRSDVTPAMRLLWRGRTLGIRSVADRDGLRTMLHLICKEE